MIDKRNTGEVDFTLQDIELAIKLARKTTMKVFKDSDDEEGLEYNVYKHTTEQIIDKIKMREDD